MLLSLLLSCAVGLAVAAKTARRSGDVPTGSNFPQPVRSSHIAGTICRGRFESRAKDQGADANPRCRPGCLFSSSRRRKVVSSW